MRALLHRCLVVGVVPALLVMGVQAQSRPDGMPGFPTAAPEDVGLSSERLGRVAEALEREIENWRRSH